MIEAVNLSYFYAPGDPALQRISFRLTQGERVLILGANGAGKSTLLGLLNGLLRPCAGQLRLLGAAVEYSGPGLSHLRNHVATVLQDPADQLFGATVLQDVAMGPAAAGASEGEALARGRRALEALEIGHLGTRPIHALSVGEKKRVALAGVLIGEPSLLLLDEPTAGLDANGEDLLLDLLRTRSEAGLTICLATHDTSLLERWATRAIVLRSGQVAFDGTASGLLRQWPAAAAGCALRRPVLPSGVALP